MCVAATFLSQQDQIVVLEGGSSDTKPVTSGVPQGTVLGPLLFLVCINDLPKWSQVDADELQADLDALQEWEQQWMMSFHPQKCQVLRITRNKYPVKASYVIHGHTLAETDTAKYLGVSLHKPSSWSPHVSATAKRANGPRAFLQCNLRKAPTAMKTCTYESLIRQILEYSGVVWDPHTVQDVNKLEPVRPLHIPGLWSNQQRHCHPENSRLGTPSGTPCEGPHHHDVHDSSWSC